MEVKIFTGSVDSIRDAMASDAASAYAHTHGSKVEDVTAKVSADPQTLIEIDSALTLFAEPRVLLFFGSAEPLFKVLPLVSGQDTANLLVISAATFAKSKAKGVTAEVVSLPAVKNPADVVKFYLSSVPGFPSGATGRIAAHFGRELNRLPLLISALRTQYGHDLSEVSVEQVMELAGDPALPAPWDLTDAVDRSDIPGALRISRQMMASPKGSPYGIAAILSNHFLMMFRLSQAGITDEHTGAQMLGIKGSTYPVKKAINTARRYGGHLPMMVKLVDQAQANLKGGSALDGQIQVEVLISRLASH